MEEVINCHSLGEMMESIKDKIDGVEDDCIGDLIELAGVEVKEGSPEEVYKRSALDMKKRGYSLQRNTKTSGFEMFICFALFKDDGFVEGRIIHCMPVHGESTLEMRINVVKVDEELFGEMSDSKPKKEGKVIKNINFSKYN